MRLDLLDGHPQDEGRAPLFLLPGEKVRMRAGVKAQIKTLTRSMTTLSRLTGEGIRPHLAPLLQGEGETLAAVLKVPCDWICRTLICKRSDVGAAYL